MGGPVRRDGVMLVGATGTGAGQVLGPWVGVGGKVLKGAWEAKRLVSLPYGGLAGPLSCLVPHKKGEGKAECNVHVGFQPGVKPGQHRGAKGSALSLIPKAE